MKKTLIRVGTFETNSSSAHSICFAPPSKHSIQNLTNKISVDNSLTIDSKGEITLYNGEFGWEWKSYNDALTKASYLFTDYCPQEILAKVIKDFTGCENVIFKEESEGYIDHQSQGLTKEFWGDSAKLTRFIFDPSVVLYLGNDNSSSPPGFYQEFSKLHQEKTALENKLVYQEDI